MREARMRYEVEALFMAGCWEPSFAIPYIEKIRVDERTSAWRPTPGKSRAYFYVLRRSGGRVEDVSSEIEFRPTPMEREPGVEYLWVLSTRDDLEFPQLLEVAAEYAGSQWGATHHN